MNRKRLILFILVILFCVAALWSYSAMPRPKTVKELTYKPGQVAKPEIASKNTTVLGVDDGTRLKISLLDNESSGFKGYRRNIFRPFLASERKVVKPKVVAVQPPKQPPPPVEPVINKPEPAPLARFTFMGFLKKGSVKTIFLAKDSEILLVKKGDTVAGRYVVSEISDQVLRLTVTDTGGEIVIPLAEKQPLTIVK